MHLRPETSSDYPAVARLNVRAFGNRAAEAVIVALLRGSAAYHPDLSLVAEKDGQIVGHALFTTYTIRLMGEDVRAALLAPLAVDPAFQKQGIGGTLMQAGHEAARLHGCTLAFLIGHPSYYPRFGYRTHAFGLTSLIVHADTLPLDRSMLVTRTPTEADLPALLALWEHEEGNVDFSIKPDGTLLDWLSPNPAITTTVYERDGEIVGYTRVLGETPRMFLAKDEDAAWAIAGLLMTDGAVTLPLHHASTSASAFKGAPTGETWEAAMAYSLAPNPFDSYYPLVGEGKRPAGRPLWPAPFDLA
ncbi:MAG: N-acetyltransferase [bacterium]|nr:N-acetyltransferase [bacterium]